MRIFQYHLLHNFVPYLLGRPSYFISGDDGPQTVQRDPELAFVEHGSFSDDANTATILLHIALTSKITIILGSLPLLEADHSTTIMNADKGLDCGSVPVRCIWCRNVPG